jgi:hypothetical protein
MERTKTVLGRRYGRVDEPGERAAVSRLSGSGQGPRDSCALCLRLPRIDETLAYGR